MADGQRLGRSGESQIGADADQLRCLERENGVERSVPLREILSLPESLTATVGGLWKQMAATVGFKGFGTGLIVTVETSGTLSVGQLSGGGQDR